MHLHFYEDGIWTKQDVPVWSLCLASGIHLNYIFGFSCRKSMISAPAGGAKIEICIWHPWELKQRSHVNKWGLWLCILGGLTRGWLTHKPLLTPQNICPRMGGERSRAGIFCSVCMRAWCHPHSNGHAPRSWHFKASRAVMLPPPPLHKGGEGELATIQWPDGKWCPSLMFPPFYSFLEDTFTLALLM